MSDVKNDISRLNPKYFVLSEMSDAVLTNRRVGFLFGFICSAVFAACLYQEYHTRRYLSDTLFGVQAVAT